MHPSLAPVSHRPAPAVARAIPAARGPARSRADAPAVTTEHVVTAILNLCRFLCTLTVVDVLRVAAHSGAEWHLVVHPSTPAPWIGVAAARGFTLLVQVDPRELASLARSGVDVNAPSTLDLLLGARRAPAAASSPRTLASLARSVPEGALTLALPDREDDAEWSITVPADALVEALDALDAWGVDMEHSVELRPRVGVTGDVELVIDGGGSHLWTLAVEPTLDDPQASVRVTLPRAEAPLSPEAWPDAEHPVPDGHVSLVGEVGRG